MIAFRIAMAALVASAAVMMGPKFSVSATPESGYSPVTVFDPARNPADDLKLAEAEATATHRNILLEVGGKWCIWCTYMDTFFANHKDLTELRDANYVLMKVNMSRENDNKEFLARYDKIPGYPHLFVLAPNGKLLHSQGTSVLEDGVRSYDAGRVREFLLKWKPAS